MSTHINSLVYMAVTILLLFTGVFPAWVTFTVCGVLVVNLAYQLTNTSKVFEEVV